MPIGKLPKSESRESPRSVPVIADDWIRQFIKHLELEFAEVSSNLPVDSSPAELRAATIRAIILTFVESGLDLESVWEHVGRTFVQWKSVDITWNDELNRRRMELIDREIQGQITSAERIELVGLTGIMREHVDSEINLPVAGAKALHRKLLELDSPSEPK